MWSDRKLTVKFGDWVYKKHLQNIFLELPMYAAETTIYL
jgi:hypothetical protein